jgi:hypothetical protein
MSKIVMGQSTPHWAQRVGDFLGNMGAQQRRQREIEEQQKQQMMQQEIERARQYVKGAADPNAALQDVPEALRPFVTYETYRDPMAQQKRKIEEAQLAERGNLYGLGGGQPQQQQPQARPFDFAVDGRVDAPPPQEMPQPQQAPQQGGSVAESAMNKLMKIRDMYGDEAMKTSAKLIMASGLPDNEEMDVLRTELGRLVDANTQYKEDAATERTGMTESGLKYRHDNTSGDAELQSSTQITTERMRQDGATSRTKATIDAGRVAKGDAGKVTDATKKAAGYAGMMEKALGVIDSKDKSGRSLEDRVASGSRIGPSRLNATMGPDFTQSKDVQAYRNAARVFTEARVRNVSGATIKDSEYEKDWEKFFVQYGDRPETIKQKREMRRQVLDGLRGQTVGGDASGGQANDPAGLY